MSQSPGFVNVRRNLKISISLLSNYTVLVARIRNFRRIRGQIRGHTSVLVTVTRPPYASRFEDGGTSGPTCSIQVFTDRAGGLAAHSSHLCRASARLHCCPLMQPYARSPDVAANHISTAAINCSLLVDTRGPPQVRVEVKLVAIRVGRELQDAVRAEFANHNLRPRGA